METKLTHKQADDIWDKIEAIRTTLIMRNNVQEDGDYKSGVEDAISEFCFEIEKLLTELEK